MDFQVAIDGPTGPYVSDEDKLNQILLTRLDLCLRRLDQLNARVITLERKMGKVSRVVRA